MIIHLDADVFIGKNVPEKYAIPTRNEQGIELELTPEDFANTLQEKLIDEMGKDFYEKNQERIIFAIAVHAIECWLLPLYFNDNKRGKVTGCLKTLNQALQKKYSFSIDAKKPNYYRKASKDYSKRKIILKSYTLNPSLKVFIQNTEEIGISFPEDEDW